MNLFRRRTGWVLADGVAKHALAPGTFRIPSDEARASVRVGDRVKLVFEPQTGLAERLWVTVTVVDDEVLEGTLASDPTELRGLQRGDPVPFERRHVVAIGRRPPDPGPRPPEAAGG